MKTYFAKAYIGIPSGMATYGETLTEKQLEALGEERVHELVKNGCLGVHDAPDPALPANDGEQTLPDPETPEQAEAAPAQPADEDEEDATLSDTLMDDLVQDEPEEKTAQKKRGKHK